MCCNSPAGTATDEGRNMAAVAFIGLGNMGVGMARRILAAGHVLRVYNRTASRADSLMQQGAVVFATPAEACAGVDAVISMVADDAASQAIWVGTSGSDSCAFVSN
jgi:3-hydroxyisobutyrate dehydrogenase